MSLWEARKREKWRLSPPRFCQRELLFWILVILLTNFQRDICHRIPVEPILDLGRVLGSRSVWYSAVDCIPLVRYFRTVVSGWIVLRRETWGKC